MIHRNNLIGVVITSLAMSGCSWFGDKFRDRSGDYQRVVEAPILQVPEGYSTKRMGELLPIPAIPDDSVIPGKYQVPRPERPAQSAFEQQVKIQNMSDKRWALVQGVPSEVWPLIRNALSRNAMPLAATKPSQGLMETAWINFKDDNDYSHRFQIRIEPGVQSNSTELTVVQNQAKKGEEDVSSWSDQSTDSAREQQVLTLLAETLAGDMSKSTVSLLAQAIGGEAKVEMISSASTEPYILLKLDMDRSWASVDYSVSRGGFTAVDQDRSQGIFYVNYAGEEASSGWFSGWFNSDDDATNKANYRIQLRDGDQGVEVRIEPLNQDIALDKQKALQLLSIIRSNLA